MKPTQSEPALSLKARHKLGSSQSGLSTANLADVLGPRGGQAAQLLEDPQELNEALSEELQQMVHRLEKECFYLIFKVDVSHVSFLFCVFVFLRLFSVFSSPFFSVFSIFFFL